MQPRLEVRRFAEQMEKVLREHDHKGGWHKDDPLNLADRIRDETSELLLLLCFEPENTEGILRECADVANFAMMVADVIIRRDEMSKK